MGAKRKVNSKLYNKITKELKTPKDDKRVMKKYGLGQTTVRAIRNSSDYYHFLNKTSLRKKANKITLNSSRPPFTSADKALVVFTWITILGLGMAVVLLVSWLLSVIFWGNK